MLTYKCHPGRRRPRRSPVSPATVGLSGTAPCAPVPSSQLPSTSLAISAASGSYPGAQWKHPPWPVTSHVFLPMREILAHIFEKSFASVRKREYGPEEGGDGRNADVRASQKSSDPLFQRADGTLMVREPDGRSRIATVSESAKWSASAPKPSWWRRRVGRGRATR